MKTRKFILQKSCGSNRKTATSPKLEFLRPNVGQVFPTFNSKIISNSFRMKGTAFEIADTTSKQFLMFRFLSMIRAMLFSHLLWWSSTVMTSTANQHNSSFEWNSLDESSRKHPRNIVAFYNVYAAGEHFDGIVKDQVHKMENSGLIDRLDLVYYTTMGELGHNYTISGKKFRHAKYFGNEGGEIQTINLLWHFCRHNLNSKVLYFHNKGSFHKSELNDLFRAYLDCYNLSPGCIEALDTHDTCGWRMSPVPFPMYSGNFWWATCKHVVTLIDPLSHFKNTTFNASVQALHPCIASHAGRYFAESWIGSAPVFRPADCMSADADDRYIFGYSFPSTDTLSAHCPLEVRNNTKALYGGKCTTASTLTNVIRFAEPVSIVLDVTLKEYNCPIDTYLETIHRSYLWYGQPPTTFINWLAPLRNLPNITDGQIVRTKHSKIVFLMRNHTLLKIPNFETFLTLGKDFSETIIISELDLVNFRKGDLPSTVRRA